MFKKILLAGCMVTGFASAAFAGVDDSDIFSDITGGSANASHSGGIYTPTTARSRVSYSSKYRPGSVIVDTKAKYLYLVETDGKAMRYGIGSARPGFEWGGSMKISRKAKWPSWTPTASMRKRIPGLPITMKGGITNPLGARALYLGTTLYRIHGTNEGRTIGGAVSSGCIRLHNKDVEDLYERVKVGTRVVVLR